MAEVSVQNRSFPGSLLFMPPVEARTHTCTQHAEVVNRKHIGRTMPKVSDALTPTEHTHNLAATRDVLALTGRLALHLSLAPDSSPARHLFAKAVQPARRNLLEKSPQRRVAQCTFSS